MCYIHGGAGGVVRLTMQNPKDRLDRLGNSLVSGFQLVALFVIGATIVWSAAHAYIEMIHAGRARLDDILLLFIFIAVI